LKAGTNNLINYIIFSPIAVMGTQVKNHKRGNDPGYHDKSKKGKNEGYCKAHQ